MISRASEEGGQDAVLDGLCAGLVSHDGPLQSGTARVTLDTIDVVLDIKSAQELDKNILWQDAVSFTFLVAATPNSGLSICRAIEQTKNNKVVDMGVGVVELMVMARKKAQDQGRYSGEVLEKVCETLKLLGYHKLLYQLGLEWEDIQQLDSKLIRHRHQDRLSLFRLCEQLDTFAQVELAEQLQQRCLATTGCIEIYLLELLERQEIKEKQLQMVGIHTQIS